MKNLKPSNVCFRGIQNPLTSKSQKDPTENPIEWGITPLGIILKFPNQEINMEGIQGNTPIGENGVTTVQKSESF